MNVIRTMGGNLSLLPVCALGESVHVENEFLISARRIVRFISILLVIMSQNQKISTLLSMI